MVAKHDFLYPPPNKQIRRERALDGLMGEEDESVNEGGGEGEAGEGLEEETRCKKAIEVEKRVYKDSFQVIYVQ